MHSGANDIPPWLASLSDRTLRRLNSRLTHLLRMIDTEMQRREAQKLSSRSDYTRLPDPKH